MNDLIQDIQRLESAVINLTEGASDEKRMAIYSLESMIAEKKAVVEQFEKEFAKYTDSKYGIVMANGSLALESAYKSIGLTSGDEIITTPRTFIATSSSAVLLGAKPVFVDVLSDTWCINPAKIEAAITPKTKAIIAVHLYGNPYKVSEINYISKKYQIPVVEDCAEALGSTYEDKFCGTFGDFSILSFNGNKIITTSGGGALISKSERMKNKAIFLSTQARDPAEHYEHSEIGYNYRLSNICAGIGRGQLKVIEERVQQRTLINEKYRKFFSKFEHVNVFKSSLKNTKSNNWLTTIILDSKIKIHDVIDVLKQENIECRPLWKPMHLQPLYSKYLKYESGVSENLFNHGLCLPSGSNITEKQIERIFITLEKIF